VGEDALELSTGMREGELLALKWSAVDLDHARLQVRATVKRTPQGFVMSEAKTARGRRQLRLTPTVVRSLRQHQARQMEERQAVGPAWEDNNLVFPNGLGRPMEHGNLLRRYFWPLLRKAGLPRIRFHDLRNTAATLLLLGGINPKIVSEMLGHASVAITLDLYSHVLPDMQRDATNRCCVSQGMSRRRTMTILAL
jgi:integrase